MGDLPPIITNNFTIFIIIFLLLFCSYFVELLTFEEVTASPIITEGPPKSLFYAHGNRVVLNCRALANPPPVFEWFLNGEKLHQTNTNDQTFFHIDTLNYSSVIHLSTKALSGDYVLQCYASNCIGVAMSNITILTQATLEEIHHTRTIQNMTSTEGRPLLLPCNHVISHPPASRTWFTVDLSSRKPSSSVEPVKLNERVTMDERGGLVFTSLSYDDVDVSRVYKCDAYNYVLRKTIAGSYYRVSIQKDLYNNVHAPDLIYSSSKVQTTVGNNATLICIFSGRPVPGVKWQRLDKQAISGLLSDNGRKLMVHHVSQEDGGMYRCIASNEIGESSTVINLSVGDAPKLLSPMEDQHTTVGASVSFTCNCSGSLDPNYDWFFNSLPINDTDLSWVTNGGGQTIELMNLDVVVSGTMTCNSSNFFGYLLESARLSVKEPLVGGPTQMTLEMTTWSNDLWNKTDTLEEHHTFPTPFNFSMAVTENSSTESYPDVKFYGYHAHNYDFSKTEQNNNENTSPASHHLNIFNIIWLLVFIFFVALLIALLYVRSRNRRLTYQDILQMDSMNQSVIGGTPKRKKSLILMQVNNKEMIELLLKTNSQL